MSALSIGSFEYVNRFQNLKFTIKGTANIQSSVLSSSEDTASSSRAFYTKFNRQSASTLLLKWAAMFSTEEDCNWQEVLKDVRDRSTIMVCEVKFGAKILPAYSPLDIKVKQQLPSGENAGLYVIG